MKRQISGNVGFLCSNPPHDTSRVPPDTSPRGGRGGSGEGGAHVSEVSAEMQSKWWTKQRDTRRYGGGGKEKKRRKKKETVKWGKWWSRVWFKEERWQHFTCWRMKVFIVAKMRSDITKAAQRHGSNPARLSASTADTNGFLKLYFKQLAPPRPLLKTRPEHTSSSPPDL